MTRLSFGDEEGGVFVEVAELAREVLEAAVSPEEGDGIWGLFQWGDGMLEDDTGE
jgi:Rad26-like, C-terminal domain